MMRPLHRSPARVSAEAARPMPALVLPLLLAAFLLPGLLAHDLWPTDAVGFGRIWSLVQGASANWLLPQVAGAPALHGGPLPDWIGALGVLALGSRVGAPHAAALALAICYVAAIYTIRLAAFRLARRDQAQPIAGAFGGEAPRIDYARLVADSAALLALAALGLFWRVHQIQADAAILLLAALATLASTLYEWRLLPAAALSGAACAGIALSLGAPAGGAWLLASLWNLGRLPGSGNGRRVAAGVLMAVVAGLGAAAWPWLALDQAPHEAGAYIRAWSEAALPPALDAVSWLLRTGAWFLWPLWPLAAWAVYAWRASLGAAHIGRPLALALAALAGALLDPHPDEHVLVSLMPPLAALAAFGATTLRRALDNFIDWFSMTSGTLCILYVGAYYGAMQAGVPHAMAASIAHLAPGFPTGVALLPCALAVVAGVAWTALLAWRVRTRPRVLWRGPLLAAAGIASTWFVVGLLFLAPVDYLFSHRAIAAQIGDRLRARGLGAGCVLAHRLSPADRALIAYDAGIRFARDGSDETCRFALQHEARRALPGEDPPPGLRGTWEPIWDGQRRVRPEEHWRLWVRAR